MQAVNKREVISCLNEYKLPAGAINYPLLLAIPSESRLPALAKINYDEALIFVTAGITMALETMNLSRSMNENQILDLGDAILDTSKEDNLALEDLMLFLQKLTRGEYGKLYESMDIPKFMEFFENYREERFQATLAIRDEQAVQHNALPINDRLIDMFPDNERNEHREALKEYLKSKTL